MRVQIPAYHDMWMRGDRFGDVVKVTKNRTRDIHSPLNGVPVAHVRLDISNKTVRVYLDDCRTLNEANKGI